MKRQLEAAGTEPAQALSGVWLATLRAALRAGRNRRVDDAFDRAADGLQSGGYNLHDRHDA